MTIPEAFEQLRGAFPTQATFEKGTHFKYAERKGVILMEIKRFDDSVGRRRFFYWLLFEGNSSIIHQSDESKFRRMQTVGDSFTPNFL